MKQYCKYKIILNVPQKFKGPDTDDTDISDNVLLYTSTVERYS